MFSVLSHFDVFWLSSDDVDTVRLKRIRQIERCLSSKLDNGSPTFFMLINIEDILERERFEIKLVTCVVIGGNRFWIRIDHNGLKSFLFQREGGVHATV